VFPCDVADDAQIDALFEALGREWDGLDGLVHAIAFAPREALKGGFHESVTRESFRMAHDISSYSLAALAKGAHPMMKGRNAAIVTLSYLGAERSIPSYNVMGLAKASLEAGVRYLAASLGPEGIRVNAISGRPHQDARRRGHRRLLEDPALRGEERAPAARRDDSRGGQCRGIPAVGPRERHHRRGHVRGRGIQHDDRGAGGRIVP
jgi:enoyl-[acyl-carrier protein] reductase I